MTLELPVLENDPTYSIPPFKVLPLPVLSGNLDTALQQPDTVVITIAAARKYFHRDLPIGDTLLVQTTIPPPPGSPPMTPGTQVWRPMRVTAVLMARRLGKALRKR